MYLSLLRAPAYANHPIPERKLVHEERFIPRVDQGIHRNRFAVCGGEAGQRRQKIDFEAQVHNETPFIFEAFPGGEGVLPKQSVILSNADVELSALYFDEEKGGFVLRLWNAQGSTSTVTVKLPLWDLEAQIELKPYRFVNYLVKDGKLEETTVL